MKKDFPESNFFSSHYFDYTQRNFLPNVFSENIYFSKKLTDGD